MLASGSMLHLVVILLIVLTSNESLLLSGEINPLGALLWSNLYLLAVCFWPGVFTTAYGPTTTDMWQVLRMPFVTSEQLKEAEAVYFVQRALEAYETNKPHSANEWAKTGLKLYPTSQVALNGMGSLLQLTHHIEEARPIFVRLLELPDLRPEIKNAAMNNLAFDDLLRGGTQKLSEADAYSLEAYRNNPWHTAVKATRGAVLVEIGRVDLGINLLKNSLVNDTDSKNKALHACHLSMAEKRNGNAIESQRYLKMARGFDPDCPLLIRAENEPLQASGNTRHDVVASDNKLGYTELACTGCGIVVFSDWLYCPNCGRKQTRTRVSEG